MLHKPSEAASQIGIPESTLRRYANQFGEHLSESANRKRSKLYTEEDLATLTTIRLLFSRGFKTEDVSSQLAAGVPDIEARYPVTLATPSQALAEVEQKISTFSAAFRMTRASVEDQALQLALEKQEREKAVGAVEERQDDQADNLRAHAAELADQAGKLARQDEELDRLRRQNRLALVLVALAIVGIIVGYFIAMQ